MFRTDATQAVLCMAPHGSWMEYWWPNPEMGLTWMKTSPGHTFCVGIHT
ncbi:MAG: hypothetical protein J4G04_06255 [Nitrosopumilaceae archaeon]|nr:hypothetical protein [Nitrosopumilaceae archaeon]